MSADNTVVILVTRGKRRRCAHRGADGRRRWFTRFGKEYRIAHVQAAENLFYESDYPAANPQLNARYACWLLGSSRVFTDPGLALKEARRIEKEQGYVEYGIRFHEFGDIPFPATRGSENSSIPNSSRYARVNGFRADGSCDPDEWERQHGSVHPFSTEEKG